LIKNMLTREILAIINKKFHLIVRDLVIIGLLFFVLASAILFYPDLLQIFFVVIFFAVSFSLLLMAVKLHNIKEGLEKILLLLPKKGKGDRK
jgi:hypothetical protein